MLIQLLWQHPQALSMVLRGTPTWVWGLLAALIVLGLSQVRTRDVGQARMAALPLAMPALSVWGMVSAFSASPLFAGVLLAWGVGAALMVALIAPRPAPAGSRFDAERRSFHVPGSWQPLALILAIFSVKYVVGADLAMQPELAHHGAYTVVVGGLYGIFSGAFLGRAVRLWRLALRRDGKTQATLAQA